MLNAYLKKKTKNYNMLKSFSLYKKSYTIYMYILNVNTYKHFMGVKITYNHL